MPELVRADEKRVRQVLINLLGNAIKFTAAGQVTFRVRHAREMAKIDIEGTCPGMSEAELAQIFEPFARGSTAGQSVGGTLGAGLRLTIAKMLTDLMGGEMTVLSVPGQGSVFRVRPEVHRAAGGVHGAKTESARCQPKGYGGMRRKLLVVDNEEADRELLVQLLEPTGFELRSAASGHDCLDLWVSGYRPDVIFMDLAMAGIDGWKTLRRIRRYGPAGIRLAIVSANAFDKGIDNDVGIHLEDFILKPARHTELIDWLEQSLGFRWCYEAVAPSAVSISAQGVLPDAHQLAALLKVVNFAFYRGIFNKLADIEKRQFRFEAMASQRTRKAAIDGERP